MPNHPRRATLLTLTLLAAALTLACRTDTADPTPTPAPTRTAAPTPDAIDAPTVRHVDWTAPAVLNAIRTHFNGGEIEPRRIAYADLTGDAIEEALLVVESGGTAGDLGAAVYTARDGRVTLLAWIDRPGHIELRPSAAGLPPIPAPNLPAPNAPATPSLILVKQGIFAPGDAECCPSRIRETTLRWDGRSFVVFAEQTLPRTP